MSVEASAPKPAQDAPKAVDGAQPVVEQPNPDAAKPAEGAAPVQPPVEKSGEGKPQAEKPESAKSVVPEKYELKLPDGSPLESAYLEKIASYAKEQGLSQEAAQKLLERDSSLLTDYRQRQTESLDQMRAQWLESSKADKEIGGDALPKNVELAKRVVDRFGTESFKKAINETGYGDHPELVRLLSKIGKAMSEDQLVMPGAQSGGNRSQDIADRLYGTSK